MNDEDFDVLVGEMDSECRDCVACRLAAHARELRRVLEFVRAKTTGEPVECGCGYLDGKCRCIERQVRRVLGRDGGEG